MATLPGPKKLCQYGFHTNIWELDDYNADYYGFKIACRICNRVRYAEGWAWYDRRERNEPLQV